MSGKNNKKSRKHLRKAFEVLDKRAGADAERLIQALIEQPFFIRVRFCLSILFPGKTKESK